jgi:hypothetical protein
VAAGSLDDVRRGEADHCPAAEVADEQCHGAGVDHAAELGRHHLHGLDGGGSLDLLEQCPDVDHGSLRAAHRANPGRRGDSPEGVDVL